MRRSHEAALTQLLQDALDNLCADSPDVIDVYVETGTIRCDMTTWSPALTRHRFRDAVSIRRALRFLDPPTLDLRWDELAAPLAECLFVQRIEEMKARQASAAALGLVQPERYFDLPFSSIAVDASLLRLFDEDGLDIRRVAAQISDTESEHMSLFEFAQIRTAFCGSQILVAHDGMGVPVISAWHSVGRAVYNGTTLQMPATVPATVCIAAVGRPVGALVATGRADIDAKTITSVEERHGEMPDGMPWPDDRCTQITVDPAFVALGANARRAMRQSYDLQGCAFEPRCSDVDWDVWAKYLD